MANNNAVPPPPSTLSLRSWLAGCAMSNTFFTRGAVTPEEAVSLAYKAADLMIDALCQAPPPIIKDLTEDEMQEWEASLARQLERSEAQNRSTAVARRKTTKQGMPPIPPPPKSPRLNHNIILGGGDSQTRSAFGPQRSVTLPSQYAPRGVKVNPSRYAAKNLKPEVVELKPQKNK